MDEPAARIAFLDFEACGLGPKSWPIEVGWAILGGDAGATLIRPAPDWPIGAWDPRAEAIHGLSFEALVDGGVSCIEACDQLEAAIGDADVYADAPAWDEFWLHQLYSAARRRPSFRLLDFARLMRPIAPGREAEIFVIADGHSPRRHRAEADARHLRALFLAARALAAGREGASDA
ncbi:MAG: hypothetical protein GC152_02700 [Alphaproteobacteria bacterium]|nr:hypothetical protein [Alphaproteobacteria bacterium]